MPCPRTQQANFRSCSPQPLFKCRMASREAVKARWRSGWSVPFAVGGPGVNFPCRALLKKLQKMVFKAFLLGAWHKKDRGRTSRQACLLCPWARHLVGRPGVHFPSRVIPKNFKKWHSRLPCLALSTKVTVERTSRLACLLCPSTRHLSGCFHLYAANR